MRKDPSFGEVDENNQIKNFKDLGVNNLKSEEQIKEEEERKVQLSFLNNRIKKRSSIMKKKTGSSMPKGFQNSKKDSSSKPQNLKQTSAMNSICSHTKTQVSDACSYATKISSNEDCNQSGQHPLGTIGKVRLTFNKRITKSPFSDDHNSVFSLDDDVVRNDLFIDNSNLNS